MWSGALYGQSLFNDTILMSVQVCSSLIIWKFDTKSFLVPAKKLSSDQV